MRIAKLFCGLCCIVAKTFLNIFRRILNCITAAFSSTYHYWTRKKMPGKSRKLPPCFESTQDFEKLKAECLANGTLFEDPEFPAVGSSLNLSEEIDCQWKRPKEIHSDASFIRKGVSRFDIKQGGLGDCWMLAALTSLTSNEKLFNLVAPNDQSFEENYAGIFHFRFWQYGKWLDVVIDDRLPTKDGELLFMKSSNRREFWSALLEKAYAKVHGSYEALEGGNETEAMEDFTGGVVEVYDIEDNQPPENFYNIMLKAYQRSALMTCSLNADPNVKEARTEEGLVKGHAFSITRVQYVKTRTSKKVPLIRVRNPWGDETEWAGLWSDKSEAWKFLSDETKKEMGFKDREDGEFWIAYKDFVLHFDCVEICYLSPCSLGDAELGANVKKWWQMYYFEGEWVSGATAGGCSNNAETFCYNPQYTINIVEPDDDDGDTCTVIVALMQKNRRRMGIDSHPIGFSVFELPDVDSLSKPLDNEFFQLQDSIMNTTFSDKREVSARLQLTIGTYVIVPATFEPNNDAEFILRVFTGEKSHMKEHDGEIKLSEDGSNEESCEDEMDKLKQAFNKYSKDDIEISWTELKKILDLLMVTKSEDKTEGSFEGFSKDICRSMVAMLDLDRNGSLDFEEFTLLWKDIKHWKKAFKQYDADESGFLNGFELRKALNTAGYEFSIPVLNVIGHRYIGENGEIAFDDFIMCAIRLKCMINIFKKKDPELKEATFTLEDWVVRTLYS